jgi:hypothetical protein
MISCEHRQQPERRQEEQPPSERRLALEGLGHRLGDRAEVMAAQDQRRATLHRVVEDIVVRLLETSHGHP